MVVKSLKSCLTLCDSVSCYSLAGSSVHGISQARRLEWVVMIRWILKIWKGLTSIDVISSVQLFSCVWLFATPWTAACQVSLSITNSWSWLKFMSIMSVMPSKHLILSRPLLPPSIFPSIRVFSNELVLCIGGQSNGVSTLALFIPMNIQDDFL